MNLWLINLDLQEFVCDNGLIKPNQYAYAENLSTTVALIMVVDSWKLAIDKGEKVVYAFLDLRKALDTINHKVLLNKLMKYGVKDREYDWFANYLSGRSQFVSYQDVQSDKRSISYGVPQRSVLGPALFNVYINGILDVCENSNTFCMLTIWRFILV
jgi:retron-type reverse transcriptase